ncbi:MAG TPA: hypothetical protein VMR97_09305 [Acidimicrobiales bacterium]|nr:hypothetical protein [Acidimicrobiales bacterium]
MARVLVVPFLLAMSALWLVPAGSQLARATEKSAWTNHDDDNWGGWSDPSNPGFASNPDGCDPIDPAQCMLPYPNDWFTRNDQTSATGRRLDLNLLAMPRNVAGKPINPADYNSSDGFSAGSTMLTVVPGVTQNADLAESGLPTDLNMALNDSYTTDPAKLGVVLLDATTGQVWPVWVEIDQYTTSAGVLPAGTVGQVQQDLMIHPAKNLLDGHRYIVALRDLHTDDGTLARPSSAFESYVGAYLHPPALSAGTLGLPAAAPSDPRTAHMDRIFEDLNEAGWAVSSEPSQLFLAWDFTTASTQNVTGRMVAIRDDAFEQLGETKAQIDAGVNAGAAPKFTVSTVTNFTAAQNPLVAREIQGSFSVPCYIAPTCSPPVKCKDVSSSSPFDDCPSPGSFFYTDPSNPDDDPSQVPGQTYTAGFICVAGRSAFERQQRVRPVEYGHGLFGSDTEVTASPQEEMANRESMLYCATDWFGWADSDIPNAVGALADLSNFSWLADRGQQGELDFLYLQRLMINRGGFASNPAFQYAKGDPIIDLSDGVYYDGNSQGGIFGGTVCAVSIDARRCALGVNGMDYSTLLPRSVDYVASSTLPEFLEQNVDQFAADPTGYDPTNLTGVGYSNAFDLFYPDQSQRQLTLDIIESLWDRADPNGYAGHMTASAEEGLLPDCTGEGAVKADAEAAKCPTAVPDHHVLMQIAWGDHQVANVTALDEARTIGAQSVGRAATSDTFGAGEALLNSRLCNTDAKGHVTTNDPVDGAYCYEPDSPLWGITPISAYPYGGSAIAIFDAGPDGDGTAYATDPPPPSDVPSPDTSANIDPHEAPRRTCAAQDMKGAFFDTYGQVTGMKGYVTDPPQLLIGFVGKYAGQPLESSSTLAGPPYFSGGWQGTCALP